MKRIIFTLTALLITWGYSFAQVIADFESTPSTYTFSSWGYGVDPAVIANPKPTGNSSAKVLQVQKDGAVTDQGIQFVFSPALVIPSGATQISLMVWTDKSPARIWMHYASITGPDQSTFQENWCSARDIKANQWDTLSLDLVGVTTIDTITINIGRYDETAAIQGNYYLDNIQFVKENIVYVEPVKTITINKVNTPPNIDGINTDACWTAIKTAEPISYLSSGSLTGNTFGGEFKACWDKDFLYLLLKVTDGDAVKLLNNNFWYNDGAELYLDPRAKFMEGDRKLDYQHQIRINYGGNGIITGWDETLADQVYGTYAKVADGQAWAQGYILELALAWKSMYFWNNVVNIDSAANLATAQIRNGKLIGLGIALNDGNATGTARDAILLWTHRGAVGPFESSSAFGALLLNDPTDPNFGIEDHTQAVPFNIFPNPVENQINLGNYTFTKVSIFDITGNMVYSAEGKQTSINVSNYNSGLYLMHAETADHTIYSSRFIKK